MVTVTMKKRAMLGQWASNDLDESSYTGVTAQVQCYSRIGMSNATAVSDVVRNGLLSSDGTKKQINHATKITKKKQKDKKRGLYHGLPKDLHITLLMMCMEDSPATRKQNNDDLNRSRECRAQKDKVAKEKGVEDAEDEFIECIIDHRMWDSKACWKTVTDVTAGLRRIKTKSGKLRH